MKQNIKFSQYTKVLIAYEGKLCLIDTLNL